MTGIRLTTRGVDRWGMPQEALAPNEERLPQISQNPLPTCAPFTLRLGRAPDPVHRAPDLLVIFIV